MRKKIVVLCGGCFNIIHEGHIWFLQRAQALGDSLVVVVASNAHNKKPYARPAAARVRALRALKIADKVVVGNPRSFTPTVFKVKPSIIALGYDQTLPRDVAEKIEKLGIKVKRIKRYKKFSTRTLERRKNRLL